MNDRPNHETHTAGQRQSQSGRRGKQRRSRERESALNSLAEMQEEVGGGADEAEAEEDASVDRTIALHCFETEALRALLFREREIAEGKKKGRNTLVCT